MSPNTTEQAIMEAAETLFLEKGFAGTSTVEIAKKAGCNQALVHYYYRSKKNLFSLVFRKKAGTFISSIMNINDQGFKFEDRIRKRVEAHFEFIRANPKLPVLFFNEVATNHELVREVFERFTGFPLVVFSKLQEELDAEHTKGTICKTTALDLIFRVFSINVMTFMMSPLLQLIMKVSDEDMETMLEQRKKENVETIMNSLKP